ncbi:unnamed protein product [marine sediment metagenome]|uniref:Uncharacterized protein n=1 Tax=marine sediment metagenome TaxID=412755 RepID=X0VXE3_9ZZZZ
MAVVFDLTAQDLPMLRAYEKLRERAGVKCPRGMIRSRFISCGPNEYLHEVERMKDESQEE